MEPILQKKSGVASRTKTNSCPGSLATAAERQSALRPSTIGFREKKHNKKKRGTRINGQFQRDADWAVSTRSPLAFIASHTHTYTSMQRPNSVKMKQQAM